MREAALRETDTGLVPDGDGWFVVNAREARWRASPDRAPVSNFEGDGRFEQIGINLMVIEPGRLGPLYHAEDAQEDFLVLAGECLLLIEGQERRLGQWDFVHCPPGTEHALHAAGDERCLVLAAGARPAGVVYPVSELARAHGVGVERETGVVDEAYAAHARRTPTRYREEWLGS